MSERKRYQGTYCALESSMDGKAILNVHLARTKRNGEFEYLDLEVEVERSSVSCVVYALRKFLLKEQEQLNQANF
jgi:hypothetical protein